LTEPDSIRSFWAGVLAWIGAAAAVVALLPLLYWMTLAVLYIVDRLPDWVPVP
jgi:hypothetical protein